MIPTFKVSSVSIFPQSLSLASRLSTSESKRAAVRVRAASLGGDMLSENEPDPWRVMLVLTPKSIYSIANVSSFPCR
jgi:hypothetical protein